MKINALRILQTIQIVEANTLQEVNDGKGLVIAACNNPITIPIFSLSGIDCFPIDIDSFRAISSASPTVTAEIK